MRDMNHSMRKTFADVRHDEKSNSFILKSTPNGHLFTRDGSSINKTC